MISNSVEAKLEANGTNIYHRVMLGYVRMVGCSDGRMYIRMNVSTCLRNLRSAHFNISTKATSHRLRIVLACLMHPT